MNDLQHEIQDIILRAVPREARVLDLGCGEGQLLRLLEREREIKPLGLEINLESIVACLRRGVPVMQTDIDSGLSEFDDSQFDIAILKQTLQQVKSPRKVFSEMLRVARESIIVFPNFAYWRNRIQLTVFGNMPVTPSLPYEWYDTPNIHLMSLRDMDELCRKENVLVRRRVCLGRNPFDRALISAGFENLGASQVLIHVSRHLQGQEPSDG